MNLKELLEKRNALLGDMEKITNAAASETRALTEAETATFDALKAQLDGLDDTIKRVESIEQSRAYKPADKPATSEEEEIRAFDAYLRTGEIRAMAKSDNGAIVPTHIAKRIIETIKQLSPILKLADVQYNAGKLVFPVYGAYSSGGTTHDIVAAYVDENTEPTEDSGKFTSVELTGFIVGVRTKISKSLINNTEFDIVSYVAEKVAEAIAQFLEKELLIGTANKATGVVSSTNTLTAADDTTISADDLVELQLKVIQQYQPNACWIMAPSTWLAIRKLKDSNNQYLIGGYSALEKGRGFELFGKPVYLSENMASIAASAKTVVYGDMKGLAVKFSDRLDLAILREKYAEQYAVGITAHCEFDSKIVDHQRIAVLVQAAA